MFSKSSMNPVKFVESKKIADEREVEISKYDQAIVEIDNELRMLQLQMDELTQKKKGLIQLKNILLYEPDPELQQLFNEVFPPEYTNKFECTKQRREKDCIIKILTPDCFSIDHAAKICEMFGTFLSYAHFLVKKPDGPLPGCIIPNAITVECIDRAKVIDGLKTKKLQAKPINVVAPIHS